MTANDHWRPRKGYDRNDNFDKKAPDLFVHYTQLYSSSELTDVNHP